MPRPIPKYVQRITEDVKAMSNDELFSQHLSLICGDDYDGCFTARGLVEFNIYHSELVSRLKANNFLSEDYGKN